MKMSIVDFDKDPRSTINIFVLISWLKNLLSNLFFNRERNSKLSHHQSDSAPVKAPPPPSIERTLSWQEYCNSSCSNGNGDTPISRFPLLSFFFFFPHHSFTFSLSFSDSDTTQIKGTYVPWVTRLPFGTL